MSKAKFAEIRRLLSEIEADWKPQQTKSRRAKRIKREAAPYLGVTVHQKDEADIDISGGLLPWDAKLSRTS